MRVQLCQLAGLYAESIEHYKEHETISLCQGIALGISPSSYLLSLPCDVFF